MCGRLFLLRFQLEKLHRVGCGLLQIKNLSLSEHARYLIWTLSTPPPPSLGPGIASNFVNAPDGCFY
jgi:hypothetical protein